MISFLCRLCQGVAFDPVLNLGPLPLSNNFAPAEEQATGQPREPVEVCMCTECRLIQLRYLVDRDRMFRRYPWTSSSSDAAVKYANDLSLALRGLVGDSGLAVEVGSNDGLVLKALSRVGYRTLGVEPSVIARDANDAGIPTIEAYFDEALSREVLAEFGRAKVVLARNVLGHTNDLSGMLGGIAHLVSDDGLVLIEVPYMSLIRESLSYDYFFHEHVSYFTVRTLRDALRRFGFYLVKLRFSELNGGSLVCYAKKGPGPDCVEATVLERFETLSSLNCPSGWTRFAADVSTQRRRLRSVLKKSLSSGLVIGYGAAAKTITMLNYCGVTRDLVPAIADGNPYKVGLYTAGGASLVISPAELPSMNPALVLIGPSNMAAEIAQRLEKVGYNGEVLLPLPYPTILNDPRSYPGVDR